MKRFSIILLSILLLCPPAFPQSMVPSMRGKAALSPEIEGMSALHQSFPLGLRVKIENTDTGKEVEVIIIGNISPSSDSVLNISLEAWEALALEPDTAVKLTPLSVSRPLPSEEEIVPDSEIVDVEPPPPAPVVTTQAPPTPAPAPAPAAAPTPPPAEVPPVQPSIAQAEPSTPPPAQTATTPPPAPATPVPEPVVVPVAQVPPIQESTTQETTPPAEAPPAPVSTAQTAPPAAPTQPAPPAPAPDAVVVPVAQVPPIQESTPQPAPRETAPVQEPTPQTAQAVPPAQTPTTPPEVTINLQIKVIGDTQEKQLSAKIPPGVTDYSLTVELDSPPATAKPAAPTSTAAKPPATKGKDSAAANKAAPIVPGFDVRVIPGMPDPKSRKIYRLQVGSYSDKENADHSETLMRSAGFKVEREMFESKHRVVAVGIAAKDVYAAVQKIGSLGFSVVWVRE